MKVLQDRCDQLEAEVTRLRGVARLREQELQAVFNCMPQLGWTARPDGSVDFCNQRWYEYTGTTLETTQGSGWQDFHDPRMLPGVVAAWQASVATGQPFDMEFPLRGRDGKFRWFQTRAVPVRDSNGAIVRWVGINVDIDDRKRADEENTQKYKLLVQSV